MKNPIEKFNQWWVKACVNSPLKQKNAVCVSTINAEGFPAGRFVDLKFVSDAGFIFCTCLDSEKGQDIRKNIKVALTCWWDHVGYQVRILGYASEIPESQAEVYWRTRSKEAQLTTVSCKQSQLLLSENDLVKQFGRVKTEVGEGVISKPDNWGGYLVSPVSIEFLTFSDSRLHLRELFKNKDGLWDKALLQP